MNCKKLSNAFTGDRCRAGRSRQTSREVWPQPTHCASSSRSTGFGVVPPMLKYANFRRNALRAALLGAALLALGAFAWAILDAVDLPTVYESHTTGKCVRVELSDGSLGDCSNLPGRYHHVWVE